MVLCHAMESVREGPHGIPKVEAKTAHGTPLIVLAVSVDTVVGPATHVMLAVESIAIKLRCAPWPTGLIPRYVA